MNTITLNLNRNVLLSSIILITSIVVAISIFAYANAGKENITFPVAELENCTSKEECKAYCDKKENFEQCIDFSERHKLMSQKEARKARKGIKALAESAGPGGCTDEKECRAYCDDTSHIDECLAFAEKHKVLDPEELQEVRRVTQTLKQGGKLPGGCKNKKSCEWPL